VKLEKLGGFTAKQRGAARVDRCRPGRIGSRPSDLDPTAGLARMRASGGGRPAAALDDKRRLQSPRGTR
jgi:hypothetical protein